MAQLIEIPSLWGQLGQGFQAALQNAIMFYLMKKIYPELFSKTTIQPGLTRMPDQRLLLSMLSNILPQLAPGPQQWMNLPYSF